MPNPLTQALVLIGFISITGQIVLLRELLVVFHGNEVSTAVVLTAWLVWTSAGSFVSGRTADTLVRKRAVFAMVQAAVALLLPLSILAARLSRVFWAIPVGETIGFHGMMVVSFTVSAPFCFLSGFLFALGCSLHAEGSPVRERSTAQVYLLEVVGSGLGGLLFALLFMHLFNHPQTAFFGSLVLAHSAARLFLEEAHGRKARVGGLVAGLALVALCLPLLLQGDRWEQVSRQWTWLGHDLVGTVDTPYGNLSAATTRKEISFFENGLWMFTYPDAQSAEEAVHYALLAHPEPKEILLVGGGLSGTLIQVLKHPSVAGIDYVELDPGLVSFAREHLPDSAVGVLKNPRVRLIHADGRRYVQTAAALYDVVIIDLPDPTTIQLNRFYTREFFAETRRILRHDGLLAVGLSSSADIVGPTLAQTLASLYRTLEAVYPHVNVVPGSTARFFASADPGVPAPDPVRLSGRIAQRGLQTTYVREHTLFSHLSPGRVAYLGAVLDAVQDPRVNTDLHPSSYYYDLIHWSATYARGFHQVFLFLDRLTAPQAAWALVGLSALFWAAGMRRLEHSRRKSALIYGCLVMGFSELALTFLLILVFQVFCGSLYHQLALLITLFMAGLAAGTAWILRGFDGIRRPWILLGTIQAAMALCSLGLLGTTYFLQGLDLHVPYLLETVVFAEAFVCGFVGGMHFSLSGKLYTLHVREAGKAGSMIYGVDLAGSAAGSLTVALVLFPLFGISGTLVLLCVWNACAAAVLLGRQGAGEV